MTDLTTAPVARLAIPAATLAEICRRFRAHELAVFGSELRNDFRPDSDVDLLVLFEPGARVGFMTLGALEQEPEDLLGRRVDSVPKGGPKPRTRDAVLASARGLYAA